MLTVCFAGNVCKDPELRKTQNSKDVASFSVAINIAKDKTEFINVVAWEGTARLINDYVKKGDRLSGTGTLSTRKWEDKNGETRYTTEVIVREIDLPPKRSESNEYDQSPVSDAGGHMGDMEDEIPFAPIDVRGL